MVVKKFNYFRFFIFIIIVISIIVGSVYLIKTKQYRNTYEYKLSNVGYSEGDIKFIQDKLKESQIDKLLTIKYDDNIKYFLKEKYFIFDNLEKYLNYKNKNKDLKYNDIVAIINTEANIDWFDNEKQTDISKNELMLVNRIYGLEKDYVPNDIVNIPMTYAYSGNKISKSILDKIIELINAGKEEGFTFVVSQGYRSYDEQKRLYDSYASSNGMKEADKFVARAGHSEYQTGLTFDLKPYNKVIDDVENNPEYLWLRKNAYKYGFIFRLEKDKEKVTGFKSSTWKLRYVGETAASLIYSEKICFEEYYAYFVMGDN